MPDTITITPSELRRLVKAAVTEAFQEQRAVLHDMVVDAIEDIGLAKAMDEANDESTFTDQEFFAILGPKRKSAHQPQI